MHRFAESVRLKPGSRYGPILWWPSEQGNQFRCQFLVEGAGEGIDQ